MQDCKPISTPFPTNVKLSSKMSSSSKKERMEMSRLPYASAVGSLIYIKGTSDVALCFGELDVIVKGYVDSDYAGDLDESKSTTRQSIYEFREKVEEGTVDMQKIHTDDNVAD
ncbi:hypothetical protein Tco_1329293 [Tanacetum coccineum]